ncbi:MAG: Phosphopantothenoylcysteine decarboxylase / Phosphopantothenate-cysteine ligase [Bryobacterales bacterium]|nr:Phosphopantothenoylcysteine decarboxylase / Phosphopantothenate-cysteine ligase [Bryobacterales bacterium]
MRIVLAVGGGIAAYKSAEVARLLVKAGHEVQAVLTASAQEFIRPLTFSTLTGKKVITELFSESSYVEHIEVAREHDLLLIAPATAGILARLANGHADDFLSTMYLAFTGNVVLAPSMNDNMWSHPATQANLALLESRGAKIVSPGDGFLACGTTGPGRLAEPEDIVAAITPKSDLEGETILITAGPTQEPIDPVRYLSNRSSGKMGYALAEAALNRGAKVILVSGPVNLKPPAKAEVIAVRTAVEMRDAVFAHLEGATIIVKCAAVADYRVANVSQQKIKKTAARLSLEFDPTPDILAELGRKKGDRVLIGFAAETENLKQEAERKLESKNCDMIVANLAAAVESDTNEVMLALRTGETISLPRASKREVAEKIFDQVLKLRLAMSAHGD